MVQARADAPSVSVLINNYNYGQYVGAAIESALSQDHTPLEVIVVDDGSTDDSLEEIRKFGDHVKLLPKSNGGQASALNAGLTASTGNIICLLDSDDVFLPSKIRTVVGVFQRLPSIDWCHHKLRLEGEVTALELQSVAHQLPAGVLDLRRTMAFGLLPYSMPPTSGLSFRKKLLDSLFPLNEDLRITADNYLKFAAAAMSPGYFIPAELGTQFVHGKNLYFRADKKRRSVVNAMLAHSLRQRVPSLRWFSARLAASALAVQWRAGIPSPGPSYLREYLQQGSAVDRLAVYAGACLHLAKIKQSR